jgi:hypothetical protein
MRTLSDLEISQVSGGLCENLSLAQCFAGVVDQVAVEVQALAGYAGQAWDSWREYNTLGIWLYDVTHGGC